jgi:UDP-N-acetylglucosamine--N-acetylmuramyl-(pentapeptide) pyrophosphoryl-undecaprenol N-acetylglucosamine transferase
MQAFPGAFPKADVVGNPVRVDVLALPLPQERLVGREGPVRVLVVGGSQGARILNQTLPQVAAKLGDAVTIWHQSGKGGQQTVEQAYADAGQPQHKVTEFIDDMAAAYAWADVVVCRSGALTVSEIAAAGLPALFVPFQHKDRQQYWNALPLEKAGAAKIFEQPQFTADAVATTLAGWDRKTLLEMAQHARAAAIPDATERVAKEVSLAAQV